MPELAAQIEAMEGISGNRHLTLRQLLAMRVNTSALRADLENALAEMAHEGAAGTSTD